MDWQEAALVVMRIEQRQLLMAMRDIAGVVDIERDRLRRAWRNWRNKHRRGRRKASRFRARSARSPTVTWSAASTDRRPYRASARKRS